MNVPNPTITTGPLPASRKIHVPGVLHPEIRVPMREISVHPTAGEPPLPVYDSSGPYTDPDAQIDIAKGLAPLRRAWIENMSLAAALMWPMSMAVALLAPLLVVTILDDTWLPAASIVSILAVSKSIEFFANLLEPTMLTTGNAGRQLKIRSAGAVTLIVALLAFGRFGPEAAAYCHLAASVVVGAASLAATAKALEIPLRDMVMTFMPGAALAALTYVAVHWSSSLWGSVGSEVGLGLTPVKISVTWLILMAIFLRRRVLVLPTP